MVVRCTGKLLSLLGKQSVRLVEAPPSSDDWYANLLWLDRRKCLLITHAGTLFSLFVADIRVNDVRPFERHIVDLLTGALLDEGLPSDALGRFEPSEVRLAKTTSRHVLGVMNQMAFEIGWAQGHRPGLVAVPNRDAIAVVLALGADHLLDLELHQLVHDAEPDADAERKQTLSRCPDQLAQRLLDSRWERTLGRLQGRDDLGGEYLLHGGSSCPRGFGLRPARSQRERTRREDRRSKFYEISDNLLDVSLRATVSLSVTASRSKLPHWLLHRLVGGFFWLLAIVAIIYIILDIIRAVLGR